MILNEDFTLHNGLTIPKLGLGTWFIPDAQASMAVQEALALGYRHIDTAQAYQNEQGVGAGVRTAADRDSVFVTTKLAAEIKSYPEAIASIDGSLRTLGLDHIDLMIIHSPKPWLEFHEDESFQDGNREAWRALEDAYQAGKLRSIGVSNFKEDDVENILGSCRVKPMVNQILAHVGNTPFGLVDFCQSHGILVEAYSPVGHGELLKNTALGDMATQYGVTVPQLCIRYCLELGMLPLPKTANPAHMATNAALDFTISSEDMIRLKAFDRFTDYGAAGIFPVYGGRLK